MSFWWQHRDKHGRRYWVFGGGGDILPIIALLAILFALALTLFL